MVRFLCAGVFLTALAAQTQFRRPPPAAAAGAAEIATRDEAPVSNRG